ncbi:MAG: serine hydrolase [Deltaproteobacteria bacterium]|nr:serine hydrolase [Deltaproteobacteria bacterium]
MDFQSIELAFEEALRQGVFPGAVLLIGRGDEVIYERAFGSRTLVPEKCPMQLSTIFDLASLTKPLATTIAIMLLVNQKKVRLDDQVTRFLPTFGVFDKSLTTLRQLLNHSSGLAAWKPFYEEVIKGEENGKIHFVASRAAQHYVLEQIHREKPLSRPGMQALYSDLGFLILGELVETISGSKLDTFCQDQIFSPLELRSTAFIDLTQLPTRRIQPAEDMIAPTENCAWRKRILCGEVHDDNAYAVGGVAGHAGLFSSARDLHAIVARLNHCLRGSDPFLSPPLVQEFLSTDQAVSGSTHVLGWDTPTHNKSASGTRFSAKTVGHLGFTGTSVWWDLEKNCHVILLTNRVHPTRKNEKIKEFRPLIHDLIMQTVNP